LAGKITCLLVVVVVVVAVVAVAVAVVVVCICTTYTKILHFRNYSFFPLSPEQKKNN
jgi:hypothetical protein